MREHYTAPELKVVSFVPAERLATYGEVDYDDMANGNWNIPEEGSGDLSYDYAE